MVVTADDAVARWAAKPANLGGGNWFVPIVLGPSGVPEIVDEVQAEADPELAVLSAMAHGKDADTDKSARIAGAAQFASRRLDADRARLYVDLILHSLSEAARRVLQTMKPFKYEYQSDFAKHYIAMGRAEGRAALVTQLLTARFGELPKDITDKLTMASVAELDTIGMRLLTAKTLSEAMGDLR